MGVNFQPRVFFRLCSMSIIILLSHQVVIYFYATNAIVFATVFCVMQVTTIKTSKGASAPGYKLFLQAIPSCKNEPNEVNFVHLHLKHILI